jgi:hypothetical protein
MNTVTNRLGAIAAAGFLVAAAYAATPDKLAMDVDLGLWEVSTAGDMSGAPPIPEALLQRMTPEQQAKMQAAIANRSAPKKFKQCMTAEKASRGFGEDDEGGNCKLTVTTNTSSEFQAEKQCTSDGGKNYDAKIHFTLSGKRRAKGTIDINLVQPDGKSTMFHRTVDAQWLSSDCGTIKDTEMEK